MNKLKEERAKLKAMNFREKREHIWEYYKLHIAGLVILLFIVGGALNTCVFNPPKKPYLTVAFVGFYVPQEEMTALSEIFSAFLPDSPETENMPVMSFFSANSADATYAAAVSQQLMAMVAAGDLDVFIMPRDTFEEMAAVGYLYEFDAAAAALRNSAYAGLYEKLAPHFTDSFYLPDIDEEPEYAMYGVRLTGCPFLTERGYSADELYLGMVRTSDKTDALVKLLAFLYQWGIYG